MHEEMYFRLFWLTLLSDNDELCPNVAMKLNSIRSQLHVKRNTCVLGGWAGKDDLGPASEVIAKKWLL